MTDNEPLILIVDDIPSFREVLKDMLDEIGFSNFVEANDGAEALQLIEGAIPALVLSDYMMPNLNGIELLKSLRANVVFKEVPFIMVTAVSEKAVAEDATNSGASAIITKPVNFNHFRTTILQALSAQMG